MLRKWFLFGCYKSVAHVVVGFMIFYLTSAGLTIGSSGRRLVPCSNRSLLGSWLRHILLVSIFDLLEVCMRYRRSWTLLWITWLFCVMVGRVFLFLWFQPEPITFPGFGMALQLPGVLQLGEVDVFFEVGLQVVVLKHVLVDLILTQILRRQNVRISLILSALLLRLQFKLSKRSLVLTVLVQNQAVKIAINLWLIFKFL